VSQPDNGEQALEIAETLIRSARDNRRGGLRRSACPQGELEGDMGRSADGIASAVDVAGVRKLTGIVSKSRTCLISSTRFAKKLACVRQPGDHYRRPRTEVLRVDARDIRRIQAIKEGDKVVVLGTRAKVVKNKGGGAIPRGTNSTSSPAKGFRREGDLIDLGVDKGVLERAARGSASPVTYGPGPRKRARLPEGKQGHSRQAGKRVLRKKAGNPAAGIQTRPVLAEWTRCVCTAEKRR